MRAWIHVFSTGAITVVLKGNAVPWGPHLHGVLAKECVYPFPPTLVTWVK